MDKARYTIAALVLAIIPGSYLALAQQNASQQHPMTFFVTSVGIGNGGNLGGLAGADAHCLMLATAVGAGNHTWHAYLSAQAKGGQPAINARDRIGQGPWYNARGQQIAEGQADLHGDTLELAQLGSNLFKQSALNEKGKVMNGVGDSPNTHDMLTGSQRMGEPIRAIKITLAITGPAAGRAALRLDIPIASAAGTRRGILLMRKGVQPGQPGEHRRCGVVLLLRH